MTDFSYRNDQELPSIGIDWLDANGNVIDFSSGWTFSVKLARATAPTTTLLLKTSGISGAATAPNVTIDWSTTDWAGLEADTNGTAYVVHVYARRTADSKDRVFRPEKPITLKLYAAAGTSAVSPSSYPVTVTAATVSVADAALNFPGPASAKNVEVELAQLRTFDLNTIAVNDWPPNAGAAARYVDVVDPGICSSTVALSNQRILLCRFTVARKITVNAVQCASDTTVSAGITTGLMGIYAVGDDGQSWPLGQSANDTTLFGSAQTSYIKNLSTTGGWPSAVTLVPGRTYATAILMDGTTMPTIGASPANRTQLQPMMATRQSGAATSFLGNIPTADNTKTVRVWMRVLEGGTANQARSVVLLGDSFFASFGSWVGLGIAQGGSRLHVIRNKGVGSETLAQFYARWATDVLAYSPEWVMIGGASNDIFAEGVDSATVISRYQTIINAAAAAGINLLICIPGSNTAATAGQKTTLAAVRTFLLGLTQTSSLKVCDTGITLTTGDGVTADATKLTDVVHPNAAGLVVLSAALAATVATIT